MAVKKGKAIPVRIISQEEKDYKLENLRNMSRQLNDFRQLVMPNGAVPNSELMEVVNILQNMIHYLASDLDLFHVVQEKKK
jgi:hypothetical protein